MTPQSNTCFKCGNANSSINEELYGYTLCIQCKSNMGLFQTKTIQRHIAAYAKAKAIDPTQRTYKEEIQQKLVHLEKDYIGKKIKLLYLLDQVRNL